jgi:hypothetical protein
MGGREWIIHRCMHPKRAINTTCYNYWEASFLLSGVKCLILSWLCTCYSLTLNCTYPLRTDSRNSLLPGSAYSLTAPSLILKPSFQSFRVTSVWESCFELEGGPITEELHKIMIILSTRRTFKYHIFICN